MKGYPVADQNGRGKPWLETDLKVYEAPIGSIVSEILRIAGLDVEGSSHLSATPLVSEVETTAAAARRSRGKAEPFQEANRANKAAGKPATGCGVVS
jgi:hypothetical protein